MDLMGPGAIVEAEYLFGVTNEGVKKGNNKKIRILLVRNVPSATVELLELQDKETLLRMKIKKAQATIAKVSEEGASSDEEKTAAERMKAEYTEELRKHQSEHPTLLEEPTVAAPPESEPTSLRDTVQTPETTAQHTLAELHEHWENTSLEYLEYKVTRELHLQTLLRLIHDQQSGNENVRAPAQSYLVGKLKLAVPRVMPAMPV